MIWRASPVACAILATCSFACAEGRAQQPPADIADRGPIKNVDYGRVVQVDKLNVEDAPERYQDALIGSGLGEIAGPVMGHGTRMGIAGGVVAAIAGGAAGKEAQVALRNHAYDYQIRLDGGDTISVIDVQEEPIRINERVRVIFGDDGVRLEESDGATVSRRD